MSSTPDAPTTHIAQERPDDVIIRGKSLCRDLIGQKSFTEMMFWQILGREPEPGDVAVLDACLVTLLEHGLTPSAVAARMVYSSAPEALQSAVAAGLTAVGSVFAGSMEGCGALLRRIVAAQDAAAEARRIAEEHKAARRPVPGFGHPTHKPDDPRTPRLFEVARRHKRAGRHLDALETLGRAVDAAAGRHLTINATGAIAALLGDIGVPAEIMRGFALISRCAGLVGHLHEEQSRPTLLALWRAAETAVPYDGPK